MNPLWRLVLKLDLQYFNAAYPDLTPGPLAGQVTSPIGYVPLRLIPILARIGVRRELNRARRVLREYPGLEETFVEYTRRTRSATVKVADYVRLYEIVRRIRPTYVLECGTGLSTTAIALALKHNHEQFGVQGRCISMEDVQEWFDHALELFPPELAAYAEIVLSPAVVRRHGEWQGVCYDRVPELPYDLTFVDGPSESSPNGQHLFNMDFLFVADRNPQAYGFVDHRLNTVRHFRAALRATHTVAYDPVTDTGYVWPRAAAFPL